MIARPDQLLAESDTWFVLGQTEYAMRIPLKRPYEPA